MDSELLAVFGFIGAIWGGFNALNKTQQQLNDMRNVIVTGKLNGISIGLEFRLHILENDWLPSWRFVSVINLVFGFGIFSTPVFLNLESNVLLFWLVTIVAALVPILAATTWILYGMKDLKYIRKILDSTNVEDYV